jgi:hypothetical protein
MRRAIAFAVGVLSLLVTQVSPATAATSGEQNWVVITTPGAPTRVVASGLVNAAGTVTDVLTLNPNGTFDNFAVQTFPNGTLNYHGMGTFTTTVDPRSCVGRGDVVGPFVITGGTGAYAGAGGSGTALITLYFVFNRNPDGSCVQGPPAKTYGVARAAGHLTLL